MARRCKGGFVVRYGEWVEIYSPTDELLTSFRVRSDMCKPVLDRYLSAMTDVDTTDYRIKKIGTSK